MVRPGLPQRRYGRLYVGRRHWREPSMDTSLLSLKLRPTLEMSALKESPGYLIVMWRRTKPKSWLLPCLLQE
jgi:hypothetical protein